MLQLLSRREEETISARVGINMLPIFFFDSVSLRHVRKQFEKFVITLN